MANVQLKSDILDALSNARTVDERAAILRARIARKQLDEERLQGIDILLGLQTCRGLQVGDRVEFVNQLGQREIGYVSHFALRQPPLPLSIYMVLTGETGRGVVGDVYPSEGEAFPVLLPSDSTVYTIHHGRGMPRRLGD